MPPILYFKRRPLTVAEENAVKRKLKKEALEKEGARQRHGLAGSFSKAKPPSISIVVVIGDFQLGRSVVENIMKQNIDMLQLRFVHQNDKTLSSTSISLKNVQEFRGALKDSASLVVPLHNATHVILAPETAQTLHDSSLSYFIGIRRCVALLRVMGNVSRVLLLSTQLSNPRTRESLRRFRKNKLRHLSQIATKFTSPGFLDFRYAGEDSVRKSGIPHTIIRTGQVSDNLPVGGTCVIAQCNSSVGGSCAPGDVASICTGALFSEAASDVTFEVGMRKRKNQRFAMGSTISINDICNDTFRCLDSKFDAPDPKRVLQVECHDSDCSKDLIWAHEMLKVERIVSQPSILSNMGKIEGLYPAW